jgi:hypothetical protein
MGLDLVLLPFDGDEFSYTALPLRAFREFYEALLEEQARIGRDVPDNFMCYMAHDEKSDENCFGIVTEDRYGEPMKRLKAKDLAEFFNRWPDLNQDTLAIRAYLENLPPRRMVALFWK